MVPNARPAILALADGSLFHGQAVGADGLYRLRWQARLVQE